MTTATVLNAIGLAPILTVGDLDRTIRFYSGLSFSIEERYEREGKVTGARLVGGQARINLTQDGLPSNGDRKICRGAGPSC